MIRLKDVAARAGVSLMTVSKVLRDAPDVSPGTKANIRRLAQEMGYVPDALARSLRTRRTKLFGLVVPSVAHPLLSPALMSIEERAFELGYDLLIGQNQESTQREEVCIRRLLARRVDGLFLYPVYRLAPTAPIYEELALSRVPVVLLGHRAPFCSELASVEIDDVSASLKLTRHLIGLGHRRIAFFAGPPAAPWAQERLEGYRRALREAACSFEDQLVFKAGATAEDGQNAAQQMLSESTEASAILAATDALAIGAATVLEQHGLRIPHDMSLAGFGNTAAAEHFRVPLTTVQLPSHRLGLLAANSMSRLLRSERVDPQRLAAELILRASTAPLARARRQSASRPESSSPPLARGDELP
jgi:DNA-binding LacI/PurR family transcriptional regulator